MSDHICSCEHCHNNICTQRVPIFSTLEAEETHRVVDLIHRRQYNRGDIIVTEGVKLDSLIIISSGQVKAFRDSADGKEQILYIFSEGDFFGEKNLLSNREATYSIEALEKTDVCTIRKSDFQQLLREHPDIAFKIMEELCSRLDRLENALANMGTKDVEARVSSVLLEFSKKYGKKHSKGILVELPLSREGIANYIGVARETVSRMLSQLQDAGIIETLGNKKVIILDRQALEQGIE